MRKSLKTRIVAMALAVCSVLGMCVTAQASSIADGSKTATIGLEERHTYLTTTAGTTLGATSYEYKTNDGLTGPAYCIDHGLAWTNKPADHRQIHRKPSDGRCLCKRLSPA